MGGFEDEMVSTRAAAPVVVFELVVDPVLLLPEGEGEDGGVRLTLIGVCKGDPSTTTWPPITSPGGSLFTSSGDGVKLPVPDSEVV